MTLDHYDDVIMGPIASKITSLTIVYSIVYSDADQRKHQSSASLAFVWGIHRGPVNSPHKWPVTRKMFPFDDGIMCCPLRGYIHEYCGYISMSIAAGRRTGTYMKLTTINVWKITSMSHLRKMLVWCAYDLSLSVLCSIVKNKLIDRLSWIVFDCPLNHLISMYVFAAMGHKSIMTYSYWT